MWASAWAYARDRAAAWLDDIVTDEAWAWAAERQAATLIVEVPAASGLSRALVDRMLTWAGELP